MLLGLGRIILACGLALGLAGGLPELCRAEERVRSAPGPELYARLACHGCHALEGRGGTLGPALDRVGSRRSREELAVQLMTPRRRHLDSRMPSFAFVRPEELQTLLDYLQTLQ